MGAVLALPEVLWWLEEIAYQFLLYLEEKPFVESMNGWQSLTTVVQRYTSSIPSDMRIRRNLNSVTQCIALGKHVTMIIHGHYTQRKLDFKGSLENVKSITTQLQRPAERVERHKI